MGILDPPGFDPMPRKNSFEQLISNTVNEQLAFHYNQTIFVREMVEETSYFPFDERSDEINCFYL